MIHFFQLLVFSQCVPAFVHSLVSSGSCFHTSFRVNTCYVQEDWSDMSLPIYIEVQLSLELLFDNSLEYDVGLHLER